MRAGMRRVLGYGRRRGGLSPLARRRRGIVVGFRRQTELGFQLRNPLRLRGDHLGLRQDQPVLLGVLQACKIGRRGYPLFEPDSRSFGNPPQPPRVDLPQGVSNYPFAHVVLPWIHRVSTNLKTWALGIYHGLRRPHLQSYLDEFAFRFNRCQSRQAAFPLLEIAHGKSSLTYKTLIRPEAKA